MNITLTVNWMSRNERNCFKKYFSEISTGIAHHFARLDFSKDERLLVGVLGAEFLNPEGSTYFSELEQCLSLLSPRKKEWELLSVKMSFHSISEAIEASKGCDLAIGVEIDIPDYYCRKTILVQAKRLYPDKSDNFSQISKFNSLNQKYQHQASDMLAITPCSYYILFSPATVSHTRLENTGIQIIPANIVENWRRLPPSLKELSPHCTPFDEFMLETFIGCLTGDPSLDVKELRRSEKPNYVPHYYWEIILSKRPPSMRSMLAESKT